jgi:hypothetical protein
MAAILDLAVAAGEGTLSVEETQRLRPAAAYAIEAA